ncbi:MAG: CHC2 zinc finger domain-containing protein, partial [Acidithiobacillus sp.]
MKSPISNVLSRLHKVKRTGADKWQALCPAHDDHTPSLSIKEADDGKVLLKCWAGC